jgi:hypothetical protein
LRVGKNFVRELARQVARFDVSIVAEPENPGIMVLRDWAKTNVLSAQTIERIPAALAPTVASILL